MATRVLLASLAPLTVLPFLLPPFRLFQLFVLSLPLEAALVLEVGFTVRVAYLFLALVLIALLLRRRFALLARSPLNARLALLVVIAVASAIMTILLPPPQVELAEAIAARGSIFRPLVQLLLLLLAVTAYLLTVHFAASRRQLEALTMMYVGIGIVIGLYAWYQVVANAMGWPFVDITNAISTAGNGYGARFYRSLALFRPHATFQEPLNLGHYLISVTLPLLFFNGEPRRARLLQWGLIATIGALFLSGSRGAWIGFLGGYAVAMIIGRRRARASVALVTSLAVAFMVFLLISRSDVIPAEPGLQSRLAGDVIVADPRWPMVLFAIDFWLRNPSTWLVGTGIGNFGFYSAAHFGSPLLLGANSLPLQILVEMGILGLIAFLAVIVRLYTSLLAALRMAKGTVFEGQLVGYTAGVTGMLVQHIIFGDRLPLYEWVFFGLAIATAKAVVRSPRYVPVDDVHDAKTATR